MRDLDAERTTHLAAARLTVNHAKSLGRELTPTEQASTQEHLDAVDVLDTQIKGRKLVTSVTSLGSADYDDDTENGVGGIFTPEAKAGIATAIKTRTAYRTELVGMKAALTTGSLLPTLGTGVEGGLHPNAQFPLASLFANQPADGPTVRVLQDHRRHGEHRRRGSYETGFGRLVFGGRPALTKLVGLASYSDEMSEDADFLVATLQQELVAAVIAAENELVISTFAATSGVLTATGLGTTVIDMIADAISAQESISGMTPAAIIANPATVAIIRKAKASTGGSYMVDPLTSAPTALHGTQW